MARAALTELEGAILGVLRRGQAHTAYAVRQVFKISVSAEWSGSAGAVYPAIARMKAAGLLAGRALKGGRGGVAYSLTPAGSAAHDRWLCDVARIVGPGVDPFRTRAGLWPLLPARQRRALMAELQRAIAARRDAMANAPPAPDHGDAIGDALLVMLMELRLRWLAMNG